MTTSQVARFVHKQKRSHKLALIQIGRYLKGTTNKGIILKPKSEDDKTETQYLLRRSIHMWLGNQKRNKSRISQISYWLHHQDSKLLSTLGIKDSIIPLQPVQWNPNTLIPLQAVVTAVAQGLDFTKKHHIRFKATVYQDNQGALILAKLKSGHYDTIQILRTTTDFTS